MMEKTPKLIRSHADVFAQWRLDWGFTSIYCCSLTEARHIQERIRWRGRTGMVPLFAGYEDCRCGRKRTYRP